MLTQLLPLALAAQLAVTTIEGQVRDARTGRGIAAARVELSYAQTPVDSRYSDADGRFRFAHVASGRYKISVHYTGYESSSVELELPWDTFAVVDLTRKRTPSTDVEPVISVRQYLVPKDARKEFDRARKAARKQDCAKAVLHFEKGLRTFDQDASTHNDLGNCYRRLGAFEEAEIAFKRARALSDSVFVVLNLAEVYSAQKRFEEAEAVLLDAIRKQPGAGDAYYGLALIYAAQDALEEAEASARQADAHPHRIADVHLLLADLYVRQHKDAEAVRELKTYLNEAPKGLQSDRVRQIIKSFENR
jgi:tetratricopeptide (TPR) repeat protein